MATTPPSPPEQFPQPFGKYTLLRKLARGGMAELFLARTADSPRVYVVKRILPAMAKDKSFLSMFLTEARVAAQLDHPNIIRIDDLGREGPHIYQAMEYIDGIDLERLLRVCGGRIPPDVMVQIAICLCDALYYAYKAIDLSTGRPLKVVHRDVTPGNVMITRQGVVKLVDFGVAKATAQLEQTKAGVVKGKFRYMSPEQLQLKELDGRSDLFSVGVLLYETTTGTKPFDRPQIMDIVRALTTWEPPPPVKAFAGYPKIVSDVIMHALIKDRDHRYRDGLDMKGALQKALSMLPNPQSIEEYVSQYLPPPIEIPPYVPPKKPKLIELDDDDDDEQATMMGVPSFDRDGHLVGVQSKTGKGRNQPPPSVMFGDEDEDDEDDEGTMIERGPARRKSASSRTSLPPAQPPPSDDGGDGEEDGGGDEFGNWDAPAGSMDALDDDVGGAFGGAPKSAPVRRNELAFADGPGRGGSRRHPSGSGANRIESVPKGKSPRKQGGMRRGNAPSQERQYSDDSRPKHGGAWSLNASTPEEYVPEEKDDSWKISNQRPVEDDADELSLVSRRKTGVLRRIVSSLFLLAVIGGIIYGVMRYIAAQEQKSREEAAAITAATKPMGRLAIDGVGSIFIDGKPVTLPCVEKVTAGEHSVSKTADDPKPKKVTVQPNETVSLSQKDL